MGYCCCVPGCRTGYRRRKDEPKDSASVPRFGFPRDADMQKRWLKAIPRNDLIVSAGLKVCRLHFSDDDLEHFSCDGKSRRKRKRVSVELSRLRLKSTAVPHIFPSLPKYLTKPNPKPRSDKCSSSSRLSSENARTEQRNEELIRQELVYDLQSLKEKLQKEILPDGYVSISDHETLQFHLISSEKATEKQPMLTSSVIVAKDMTIRPFVKGTLVPPSIYEDLLTANCVKKTSDINNVLARCKALSLSSVNPINYIDSAVLLLKKYQSSNYLSSAGSDDINANLIGFIIEQLTLCQVPPKGRRYSSDMIETAFMWKSTSPALYKQLLNVFALPAIRSLHRLYKDKTQSPDELDMDFPAIDDPVMRSVESELP